MSEVQYGVDMSSAEIGEFLARRGHGVLSFGGDEPYGIPISFGYDPLENQCFFQLLSSPESQKRERLQESDRVSLTAYEWNAVDDWRSVIVRGRLVPIETGSPDALEAADVFAEHGAVVGLSVFHESVEDLDGQWYELRIDEMTGYHAPLED